LAKRAPPLLRRSTVRVAYAEYPVNSRRWRPCS